MDNRPIGILDSGVGGLTVADEVRTIMPHENIIYFGDTARVPYGGKSRETIQKYGREIMRFLVNKNVKAIVIACGTISSNASDILKEEFDIPMVDVLQPGVQACAAAHPANVGFIATEATVRSLAFSRLLKKINPEINSI